MKESIYKNYDELPLFLNAHHSHPCEEVTEEAHDLREQPVNDVGEDGIRDKIPYKHGPLPQHINGFWLMDMPASWLSS